ncbi:MAG TPA: amidohydrolase family protein [Candidatus Limnocylindrales bacterium]|nr:amidohydrolase family protein [Candidatus Limnocylindrales bacterium]
MKFIGLLLTCALGLFAGETILIRDADVYPVTGPEMKSASILIQDGKIADIAVKIVPPKGARIIEAKGMRVYPGMIDSATELGLSEVEAVRETVDTGEIGEFMPQLKALVAVNPDSEFFGVVRVNGITSAMTFPSSGGRGGGGGGFGGGERQLIAGQAALIHTDGWTWEDMAVKRSAGMSIMFPSMGGGGRRGGVPDNVVEILGQGGAANAAANQRRQYEEQIAKLSEFFENARRYQKAKSANAPGFQVDLKFEAMLPVLEGKVPVTVSAPHASTIHDAIQWAKKQNVKLVVLQPREIGKEGAELKAENVPVIFGRVLALPETEDSAYDQSFTLPAEAYKAGVKFAFGTFGNEFSRDIPYQAATAVAFGLPYEEALKALTINPAQIWGVSDQVGSVEKGKLADLIVTDGDPLTEQTHIKHLYIHGREVSLENKQTRLYERYMSRNQ